MRGLFLADASPLPATTGARERDYYLARALAAHMTVEVATLGPVPAAPDEAFRLVSAGATPGRLSALLRSWSSPYQATRHTSPQLRDMTRFGAWDVVHASHIFPAPTALLGGAPVVIDAHNVETEVAWSSAGLERRRLRQARLRWEAHKIERLERRLVPRAAAVLATSSADARVFEEWGARRVVVVPNGVDCRAVPMVGPASGAGVVFVGSYDYLPNEAAAEELVTAVMPALRASVPEAHLMLVGRRPSPGLTADAPAWLDAPGEVANLTPVLQRARVTILPIRAGGGTRLKALRALAAGVPVVSTEFGVAGLDLQAGRHFLVGTTPQALAAQAARVIRDDALARQLAVEGRHIVEQRFDWTAVTAPLAALYDDVAARGEPPLNRSSP